MQRTLVLAVALLAPRALTAQDPRLKERLDPETAAKVEQAVDSARRLGLPTEPLVQKALEGRSKGAPNGRILAAVGGLLEALGQARSNLGAPSNPEELVAGALWIRAGGQAADLAALRRSAPTRPLAVPLAVSTELLSRGYARVGAVESLTALLAAGLSDPEFVALKNRVDDAVRGGSRFDTAVRAEVAKVQAAPEAPVKTAATAAIAALTLASSGAAQVRPSWSAGARLTEASVGPTDPALWFGGRLEWSAPRASFEATAAGGRGWRGRLGGELSIVSRWNHDLGGGFDARASLGGAVERPIGQETGGELWSRLGMARRIGPFVVQAGGMLLGVSRAKSVGGAGGFLSSALDLGPVTISGDVGQLATLSGSLATTTLGDGAIPGSTGIPTGDTLKAGGGTTTARRLSHALIGARIRQGRFEVYTNVLRRTPLELGESVGWEAGFAIGPVAGARLRVAAGRMPAPQTIYLPYRKQLAVGLELVGRRPTDRRDAASGDVAFDLLVGPPTLPARIVVRHPTAIRVEIAGDFSNWEPVQLVVVSPRVFETSIRLGPGAHQINVRFDGGRWEVPPGLGSAPDEFGGRAGMIVLDRE